MDTTIAFNYLRSDCDEFDDEINHQVSELFLQISESIDFSTISVSDLSGILDQFHQLMIDDDRHEHRKKFEHCITQRYKQSDSAILELKNMASFLHACGYERNAKIAHECFQNYVMSLAQFNIALGVCDEDTIIRCMRKKNPQVHLQKKIDQGVLRKYGMENFQRFMTGQPLPVDHVAHSLRQERSNELAAHYYDVRMHEQWRRALVPVYYMYLHPRQIDVALEQLVKAIVKKIKAGDDPVELAAWAYCEFIDIHPYYDGNGRVGRVFMNLLLAAQGLPLVDLTGLNTELSKVGTEVLLHKLAKSSDKAQYNPHAFEEFLRARLADELQV